MITESQVKDSGIEWLGDIPFDWDLTKNRYYFKHKKTGTNNSESTTVLSLTINGVRLKKDLSFGKSTESYIGHQLVEKNDIVFTPRDFDQTPILSGVSKYHGCISNLYIVDETKEKLHNHFVNYFWYGLKYSFDYFKNFSFGMRYSFNRYQFDEIPLLLPPLEEQKRISDYLDKKTQQIDELVQKTEKKIELLKEQRTALISHCVTKGLNPDAEMKDSGIEWIGQIPKHWKVIKISRLIVSNTLGINFETSKIKTDTPILKMGNIGRGNFNLNKLEYLENNIKLESSYFLKNGDFLFNTRNSFDLVGKVAVWNNPIENCSFNTNILRINFNKLCSSYFMGYLFNSTSILQSLKLITKGTTSVAAIYYKDLCTIMLQVPPLEEQKQIADYLDQKTQQIDKLVEKEEKRISLLKEYRQSLISSAVTGKIRVTEAML